MIGVEVQQPSQRTLLTRVAAASLLGTTLEWFDFFVFSSSAALVFNKLFFPELSPLLGTAAAFGTFATGFLTRPIGSIIFGHLGDRIGRKATLISTISLMGAGTFAVGLLPTYATIGIWAPLLLVLVRLIQGLGLGGEWGGAILLCVEHAPRDRRGLFSSFPQLGVPLGVIASALLFAAVTSLPGGQFLAWGWRLPFLLSILLLGVGMFVRLKILETPAFAKVKQEHAEAHVPILELIRSAPKHVALAVGTRFSESATSNIFLFFIIAYLTKNVHLSNIHAIEGQIIASVACLFSIPAAGALSDRYGRRPVFLAGTLFTILFAFPAFALMNTGIPALAWLAVTIGLAVGWGLMYGTQGAFYSELFPVRLRYSAIGFVYAVGALPTGAIAAATATLLLAWSHGQSWPISMYLIGIALISSISVLLLPETHRSEDIHKAFVHTPATSTAAAIKPAQNI